MSQFGELSKSALQMWRAFKISSPNFLTIGLLIDYWLTAGILLTDSWLTPDWPSDSDRPLTDYWLTPDWLLTDSWLTPDWRLTDSWLTPDWIPTDFRQTPIKPNSRNLLEMIPGLNLESCSNQLSKFGKLSKSALQIWQLSDSQKCPHRQSRDSWLTPNRFHSLISDRHISNPKAVSKKFIGCWQQVSMLRAVQINSQISSQYLWMEVLYKSLFGFLNNWKTLGMLLLFYNIPYFRE